MIHRINIFLICIFVALNPIFLINSANASTVGGWNLSNPIAQGASTLYQGAKTVLINGKNVAKTSSVIVTPVAKDVAKLLGKGVGGVALGFAVEQLLGAVDWVLDPANNRITYKIGDTSTSSIPPKFREYFAVIDFYGYPPVYTTDLATAAKIACIQESAPYGYQYISNTITQIYKKGETGQVKVLCDLKNADGVQSKRSSSFNYNYVASNPPKEESEEQEKSIPLDLVAQKIIDNANNADTNAQVATTAAAADVVAEAEKDSSKARPIVNQLESNSKTETDESASAESKPKDPAKPETGSDLSIEFPVFCGWAPTVCEAATTVINFPNTLTNWWETSTTAISDAWADVKDWVKTEEPVERETKVDLEVPVPPELPSTNYLQWNAYCPFNSKSDQVTIGGETTSIDSDLSSWCTMASEVRPFVLMAGAIASLMIVSGVSMRGDD